MKVIKSAVYRITASTGCGCSATREYEDVDYKTQAGDHKFTACKKHDGKPGVEVIEMILGELVEKEAADHVAAPAQPAPNAPRPNAAATVNANGELEMRVPIKVNPIGKSIIRPAGTAQRPVTPGGRPSAQAGRTGPIAASRPTSSVPASQPKISSLATALEEDDEDNGAFGDLLAQTDPDKA